MPKAPFMATSAPMLIKRSAPALRPQPSPEQTWAYLGQRWLISQVLINR